MKVEHQTGGKQRVDVHYAHAPAPYLVEENFEGSIHEHDDLTLAQLLLDQEIVYESLQRNAQIDMTRSSNPTPIDREERHGNSSQNVNADSQLAMDEAYAIELQAEDLHELENQLSNTSISRTSGTGNDFTRAESSTSSRRGNSAGDVSTQITVEDNVDPDNMTYEELQSLSEAIGTKSRGLSDELLSYLPVSTCKISPFQRRENHEQCVICFVTYKNRDKLITLPCQHQYHEVCITKWLKINKTCPVCNEEVFGP